MSAKNFKFISPGVFLSEIDKSRLPNLPDVMGPCIIGTANMGPAFQPVQITNQEEFVATFGAPSVGVGSPTGDPSRDGVHDLGVDYGAWAAFGYLANNSPLTFVRVLGDNHPDPLSGAGASAGWSIDPANGRGGAYGLYVTSDGARDFLELDVKQTAEDAAAHVVEVEIPVLAQLNYAQDTISIVLKGPAIGSDEVVITSANIAANDLRAGDAAALAAHRDAIVEALAAAITGENIVGITVEADGDVNTSTKVTITGPDTGVKFTVVAVDEPAQVGDATITEATPGVEQGTVPSGGVILSLDAGAGAVTVTLTAAEMAALAQVSSQRAAGILATAITAQLNSGATAIATVTAAEGKLRIAPLSEDADLVIADGVAAAGGSMFSLSELVEASSGETLTDGGGTFTVTFGGAASLAEGRLAAILHANPDVELKLVNNRNTAAAASAAQLRVANANGRFNLAVLSGNAQTLVDYRTFDLDQIRSLNCNPTLLNTTVTSPDEQKDYFLAESFEGHLKDVFGNLLTTNSMRATLLPLSDGSQFQSTQTPAATPWLRGNFQGDHAEFSTSELEPLFRIVALDSGESGNKWKVGISNIVFPTGAARDLDPYPTFTVTVMPWSERSPSPSSGKAFQRCNLNPSSVNFIGRKIDITSTHFWSSNEFGRNADFFGDDKAEIY